MKDYFVFLKEDQYKINQSLFKEQLLRIGFKNIYFHTNNEDLLLSSSKSLIRIQDILTNLLYEQIGIMIPLIIIEKSVIEDYLYHAPSWWNNKELDLFDCMVFVLGEYKADDLYTIIGKPDLENEYVEVYKHMIFFSSNNQQSKWWKQMHSALLSPSLTLRKASTIIQLLSLYQH